MHKLSLSSFRKGFRGPVDQEEEQRSNDDHEVSSNVSADKPDDSNTQHYDDEDFDKCGPTHIDSVDWSDVNHRRIVAACLVQGVYMMELDNQNNREGTDALAPKWWEHFNFELVPGRSIQDKENQSTVAAIFESKHENTNVLDLNIPKYVIAFRGTILRQKTMVRDLKLNAQIMLHRTGSSSRGTSARAVCEEFVEKLTAAAGQGELRNNPQIWLAGHSQGSTIALQVARSMAEKEKEEDRCFIETYLFNPPYPSASAPIGMVLRNQDTIKRQLHFCRSTLKARLAVAVMGAEELAPKVDESTVVRAAGVDDQSSCQLLWRPNLFVNLEDPICNGYEEHFGFREEMEGVYNAGAIEKLASKYATLNLISRPLGIKTEGAHLIQAANLTFNVTTAANCDDQDALLNTLVAAGRRAYQAHQLIQWWNPDIKLRTETI